ncbi:MAG TPA: M14 family zinc carboxypeptidase [Vicinamibacterales bacterium]
MFRWLMALSVLVAAARVPPVAPQELARLWDAEHVSPPLPPLLEHDEVERRLQAVSQDDPSRFIFERVGASLEGRSINMITTGTGPFRVLLWSQMHGDEPTATAALFDVFAYFERHRDDPVVRRILTSLTLYVVPMLNPDGAERYQRRNAQGIDINRDALGLQTPEGQLLKSLRDRLNPRVGFNLHNQGWNTSLGDPPKPASISLLSVAYDKPRSENAGRKLTKKLCAVVRDALEPFASGQIGRYDDEFEVRAFGDNLSLWGTPVVLIETGTFPSAEPDPFLVRLNFVGILSALDALATGNVEKADPKRYETLPKNESKELFILVRGATILCGTGIPAFSGDIGIAANRRVRAVDGRRQIQMQANIADLGDLRTYGALRTIDARGLMAAPLWDASLKEGQEVDLPDWSKQPSARVIAPGQPGEIVLMRPLGDPSRPASRYVIQTILKY